MRKVSREVKEWVIILAVIGILYVTGWHKVIISSIQMAVLKTGLIVPSAADTPRPFDYDFTLTASDGSSVNVSDFKGEVIFLNLWATWCPPCVAEMPDIHELYLEQKDSVRFVMLSLDENPQKARDFISKKDFDFPVYFLKSALPSSVRSGSIPTTLVVDKKGKVVVRNEGMARYNTETFKHLLSELQIRE